MKEQALAAEPPVPSSTSYLARRNSTMYSGSIENGQMHGKGRLQYANGDVFEVRRAPPPLRAVLSASLRARRAALRGSLR